MRASRPAPLFNLRPVSERLPLPMKPVGALARPALERALRLKQLSQAYDAVAARQEVDPKAYDFARFAVEQLGVDLTVSPGDLERIPERGPVIVVSNHPFGGIEGLMLASVIQRVRPDVKLMANHMLGLIPEMRPMSIFVNPFGSEQAKRENLKGIKESLKWLKGGGTLGVFPAGEVSSLRWSSKGKVQDPQWSAHIAALAKKAGAQVVPVHIKGSNSALFHLAGLLHPRLRTLLLPREMMNKQDKLVRFRIGTAVPSDRLAAFDNDDDAIAYLRKRSELLGQRRRLTPRQRSRENLSTRRWRKHKAQPIETIIDPIPAAKVEADLKALPAETKLLESGDYAVYIAPASALPHALPEIGRLREITFRAVGEGSGKAMDLDRFDEDYLHLILWHTRDRAIAGSYRMGHIDEQLAKHGRDGLYLCTLFQLSDLFLDEVATTGIEVGRSFVAQRYQRSFSPLLNLWKGINIHTYRTGRRYLIGPMSISNSYCKLSKAMMVRYLSRAEHRHPLSREVEPRFRFPMRKYNRAGVAELADRVLDTPEMSQLVTDIEPDRKGFPILIRQYLRTWGTKVIGFNVDPDFNYCLDALAFTDMPAAPRRQLERYMGQAEATEYLKRFGR